ncbi:TetR family transcriptional regulator C-terminal domain-containing protein [Herbidospora yilanensis]|uniref:TetR family transcriptional regulator C-terminal domain-containing protein n=1 Tax=Herbidospora yilanensis TaxID=354426 RepID=UPI00078035E5|nr:TetR family transcriptional regulator C-terminal domain-containing protein [Herbidospora yilanensis]
MRPEFDLAARDERAGPRHHLRALLVALLRVDPVSRMETLVGSALFARALRNPVLAVRYRQGRAALTDVVAGQLAAAGVEGDTRAAADTTLALIDGLASDILLGHHTPEAALVLLDGQLRSAR